MDLGRDSILLCDHRDIVVKTLFVQSQQEGQKMSASPVRTTNDTDSNIEAVKKRVIRYLFCPGLRPLLPASPKSSSSSVGLG